MQQRVGLRIQESICTRRTHRRFVPRSRIQTCGYDSLSPRPIRSQTCNTVRDSGDGGLGWSGSSRRKCRHKDGVAACGRGRGRCAGSKHAPRPHGPAHRAVQRHRCAQDRPSTTDETRSGSQSKSRGPRRPWVAPPRVRAGFMPRESFGGGVAHPTPVSPSTATSAAAEPAVDDCIAGCGHIMRR